MEATMDAVLENCAGLEKGQVADDTRLEACTPEEEPKVGGTTRAELRELDRWLQSGGRIGNAPDFYLTLKAAKYMGIFPWQIDMADPAHRLWRERALLSLSAEEAASRKAFHEKARLLG